MAETRITEKTTVPVSWLFFGFSFVVSTTIYAAVWVSAVNFRLQRIEEKLGIPAIRAADNALLPKDAHAGTSDK